MADLRAAARSEPSYPPILFVHLGRAADGAAFFGRIDPGARALADPTGRLYAAFGLGRGTWAQLFGPEVWACGLRAVRKGHSIGRPVGDPRQMPGFVLVEGDRVAWRHDPRHAGDHPDFARIPELAGLRPASGRPSR